MLQGSPTPAEPTHCKQTKLNIPAVLDILCPQRRASVVICAKHNVLYTWIKQSFDAKHLHWTFSCNRVTRGIFSALLGI